MFCHRLLTAFVLATFGVAAQAQPSSPTGLESRTGDQSVILHWTENPEPDIKGYRVYRSKNDGPFSEPIPAAFRLNHFVDNRLDNDSLYAYYVRAVDNNDQLSATSDTVSVTPAELSDTEFLELVQHTAFDFFWYEAEPANGLIRDRSTDSRRSSIASVGFGLSALTVGIDRGWISRESGRERVLNTLEFFWHSPQGPEVDATGYKGLYYHFLNMDTGRRWGTTELSTIDTALLLGGVLHVREYFDEADPDEERIRSLSDSIYQRVDWKWVQVRPPRISHGWRPESGFIPYDYGGYNETMILYILALGSPTHPVDSDAWIGWRNTYKWQTHYGYTFLVFPPLFGHQYTHVWVDFRDISDAYMRARGLTYFENSRRATLAQRAYAIANPGGFMGYGEDMWGFTASDGPDGYRARGAPPPQNDDGTITPTAPGGSYPFTPEESLSALRAMYDTYRTRLWHRYGFRDAFNSTRNWFASDFIGIDQGPIVLMIENGRTGAIWDRFMQHEAVQHGLSQAGFLPFPTDVDRELIEEHYTLSNFPNPFSDRTEIEYALPAAGHVRLVVTDVLGREVSVLVDDIRPAGHHSVNFTASGLSTGLYVCRLAGPTGARAVAMLLVR